MLRGGWMNNAGRIPNSLLRNDGEGRFTDVTFSAGLGDVHYPTQTAAWADYDNDGDVDIYIGNEKLTRTEFAPCWRKTERYHLMGRRAERQPAPGRRPNQVVAWPLKPKTTPLLFFWFYFDRTAYSPVVEKDHPIGCLPSFPYALASRSPAPDSPTHVPTHL